MEGRPEGGTVVGREVGLAEGAAVVGSGIGTTTGTPVEGSAVVGPAEGLALGTCVGHLVGP